MDTSSMICLLVCGVLVALDSGLGASLPASFPRCQRSDPAFDKCVTLAAQKSLGPLANGIPSLKLLPMEPLDVTQLVVHDGNGPVSLDLELNNAKVYGLTEQHDMSIKTDLDNYRLLATGTGRNLTLEGDYIMNGKFLVLPLRGKGRCMLSTENLQVEMDIIGEPLVKGGKTYMKITDFKLKVKDLTGFKVHFDNLFNGDKRLGDTTNAALNENWRDLWVVLQPSLEESFAQIFMSYTKKIFENVPMDDIFLRN